MLHVTNSASLDAACEIPALAHALSPVVGLVVCLTIGRSDHIDSQASGIPTRGPMLLSYRPTQHLLMLHVNFQPFTGQQQTSRH